MLNQSVKNSNSSRFLCAGAIFAFIGIFVILLVVNLMYFWRVSNRLSKGGELSPSCFYVYAYGAIPNEGFYVVKNNSTKVSDLAALSGASFSQNYYLHAKLTPSKKFFKSESVAVGSEYYAAFYFPPTNAIDVFCLNSVTESQLISLGLNQVSVQNILNYRLANGDFTAKQQLLEKGILTENQYKLVYANLYCVPKGFENLFVLDLGE